MYLYVDIYKYSGVSEKTKQKQKASNCVLLYTDRAINHRPYALGCHLSLV